MKVLEENKWLKIFLTCQLLEKRWKYMILQEDVWWYNSREYCGHNEKFGFPGKVLNFIFAGCNKGIRSLPNLLWSDANSESTTDCKDVVMKRLLASSLK